MTLIVIVILPEICAVGTEAGKDDGTSDDSAVFFESHIRPLLKTHCFHCHGEAGHKEANLDLRLARLIRQGGDSGTALQPGVVDESLIWQRVASNEMPPGGKSLTDSEKKLLHRWIEGGAPTKRDEPVEPIDEQWTDEDRSYWAFQPVLQHAPPIEAVGGDAPSQPKSVIDLFLLKAMQPIGLSFNPPAPRQQLIRRLTFDLLGMPPTPEQVQNFLQDDAPDAYERLVERLLADPRYGERWGRHWLDVAGYADSDGYTEADNERLWAYPYRDYVIRAHNDDLSLDRFIIQQLAGDELVQQPWDNLNDAQVELLAATGFLRTAPDGTDSEGVDNNVARNEVIAETIKIVTSSLLGLTVGCAQCHDHRYDPISQKDYYRIRAILEPGLDWQQWQNRAARQVNLWDARQREIAAEVQAQQAELEGQRVAELDSIVDDIFQKKVSELPESLQAAARQARTTPADQRTTDQLQLLKDYPSLNVDRGSAILYDGQRINEFNKKYEDRKISIDAKRPADRFVTVFTEVLERRPTTYLFYRGDFNQPREAVQPGGLSILNEHEIFPEDDPNLPTSGRRLAFARHLTTGIHPLLTRTLVNRQWMHLFGRGLVNTPGDFGALGERPTHPELLDWLAAELVASQWSSKQMTRLMVHSAAYQQSSEQTALHRQLDPENRWYARASVRRLEAEAIRDAMLQSSGMLDSSMYGPASTVNPDEVGQIIIGKAVRDGNGILVAKRQEVAEAYRRSIYTQVRRSLPLGMLEPFDPATLSPNCDRRGSSTVSPQALLLMNNSDVVDLAEKFAKRVAQEAGPEQIQRISLAWSLALAASPTESHATQVEQWLADQQVSLLTAATKQTDTSLTAADAESAVAKASEAALALLCQAIFSSNQFLYID